MYTQFFGNYLLSNGYVTKEQLFSAMQRQADNHLKLGTLAIPDLTKGGDLIRSQTYDPFLPLFGVAIIYLVIVMILTAGVHKLEMRLRTNER